MRFLLLAVGAALALASPAAAAPTWLPPGTVSPQSAGEASAFSIGSDDAGHVAAAWEKLISGTQSRIDYSLRAPGGGFTSAKSISTAGADAGDPSVDVDASGTATMAWSEPTGIKVRRIGANGSVGTLETLGGAGAERPRVAVAPSGAAVIAWVEGGGTLVGAATRAAGAATFVGAGTISPAGTIGGDSPRVAIAGNGDALVAWIDAVAGANAVRANRRAAGGGFLGAQTVLPPGTDTLFDLALGMAPDGRATAMWSNTTDKVVQFADRNVSPSFGGGTWSTAAQASPAGVEANTPSVAIDAQNTAIAVWQAKQGTNTFVQGGRRLSGGSFASFQPLSAAGGSFSAQIDVAPDGSAVAIWNGMSGALPAIQAARRAPGGGFGAVSDIALGDLAADPTVSVFSPRVAVDDQGNAAAVWSRFRNSATVNDWRVDVAGFDAAPPTLTAVSIPPGGSVGAGIGMAAAATDRWTPVSFAWNFGDGTTGAGPAVTHAFGTAGAFNVTLSAVDGVGNAATTAGPVLITATDPPPKKRITSKVRISWGVTSTRTYLIRLKIPKLPKGARAKLTCKPRKKCPFKRVSAKKRRKGGTITLFKNVKTSQIRGKRKRTFIPGARVQLRITAPGHIGKVVKYRLKRDKVPVGKELCLPVGAKKPRRSCP